MHENIATYKFYLRFILNHRTNLIELIVFHIYFKYIETENVYYNHYSMPRKSFEDRSDSQNEVTSFLEYVVFIFHLFQKYSYS